VIVLLHSHSEVNTDCQWCGWVKWLVLVKKNLQVFNPLRKKTLLKLNYQQISLPQYFQEVSRHLCHFCKTWRPETTVQWSKSEQSNYRHEWQLLSYCTNHHQHHLCFNSYFSGTWWSASSISVLFLHLFQKRTSQNKLQHFFTADLPFMSPNQQHHSTSTTQMQYELNVVHRVKVIGNIIISQNTNECLSASCSICILYC